MARGAIAGVAILAGAVLVLAPLGLRLVRELSAERTARAREAERADIAAHLHDSVLQTLSLIRSRSSDPVVVSRLARAQERELRDWLYADSPEVGDSMAAAVRQVAAEVEDLRGVPIDVVTAGDRAPDAGTTALTAATREALAVPGADLARWAQHLAHVPQDPSGVASSARNRFVGLVTAITADTVMAQVELQCGPHRVVSLMSSEAVRDLGLEIGSTAVAVVKATTVIVETARATG